MSSKNALIFILCALACCIAVLVTFGINPWYAIAVYWLLVGYRHHEDMTP